MYLRTLVSVSAVALWAVSPARLSAQDMGSGPEVITSGTGTVTLPPDRVVVRMEVMTTAVSAADATSNNAPLAAQVEAALRGDGLSPDAIRPVGFMLSPRRHPSGDETLVSYDARTTFEVRLEDVDALGRVLDVAIAAGATGVPSIAFQSDSVPAARRLALASAVAAARDDAETLAAASGGRLGALILVTTSPEAYDFGGVGTVSGASNTYLTGVPVSVSAIRQDVVVRVTVQTRWRLLP